MREHNVAFISESKSVGGEELHAVAAAVQRQVREHLALAWDVTGTVMAFDCREDVPACFSPVIIVDDIEDARGFHNAPNGSPYAIVDVSPHWSVVASHETMEMLADPTGDALLRGLSPIETQGEIDFLLEICDPCEARRYAYRINGIDVADFCTPAYYLGGSGALDHRGHITRRAEVLPGGTLAWRAGSDWFQFRYFAHYPTLTLLGDFDTVTPPAESRRARINRLAPQVYDWMAFDEPHTAPTPAPPPYRERALTSL